MNVSHGFLFELLPWCYISKYYEGVTVQKDGILQRSFAYRAPDVDSAGAFEIARLTGRVEDVTKRLDSGFAFHIEAQRFFSREYPVNTAYRSGGWTELAPWLIDREREAAFKAAGAHFESSYYITFTWKPPAESVKKIVNMFIESTSGDNAALKENITDFVNMTDTIAGILSNDILIQPLDNVETIAYLHSAVSLNRHPIRFSHTQILIDRLLPDMPLDNSNTMMLGDYYIPIIGVNDFPESTYPAMLDRLNRAKIEYRWVTRYICLSKDDAKKEISKKEKHHRGSKKTLLQSFVENTSSDGSGGTVINHGAGVKEADAISAGIEIETDRASLGYLTSCVMVWDKDYKTAKTKADAVRNIINSAGFTAKEETYNALEAWKSMLPGQVHANYRALPVMSYNLSHIIPLSSVWTGMRVNEYAAEISGVGLPHLTCGTDEGTPFFLNINPTDVGHTAVWGPTGAGKSTLLNLLEAQFLKYPNSQVIVFDKGRSCRGICLAQGGLFYEPAAENIAGIAFQPLRELEGEININNAQDFIETCITISAYKITPELSQTIRHCLEIMREIEPDARTLTTFVQYANTSYQDPDTGKPVIKEMLGNYLFGTGKYGKIFDMSVSSFSSNSRFIAFEMEELMRRGEDAVAPALIYLFNLIEKKFDRAKLSMLILDEAWLFLKNEIFQNRIAEWLKTLRKKSAFVVFATQDVADVENSPLKTTITQQCLTKIYLADPAASTEAMSRVYRAFGLNDSEINLIASSTMKRDYFYTCEHNRGRRLFQLDLGPLTLALTGSPNHRLLDSLLQKYGAGVPLCEQILAAMGVDYNIYMRHDAPAAKIIEPQLHAEVKAPEQWILKTDAAAETQTNNKTKQEIKIVRISKRTTSANITEAINYIKTYVEQNKNKRAHDGSGRLTDKIKQEFGIRKQITIAIKNVLSSDDNDLITQMSKGALSPLEAYNIIKTKNKENSGANAG
ncbi:MAG: conjugal transfer protein TrbE [Termitinemataceae bacterium]|nr:MAG: conjugal transfer protein TrbE [Termitinemataceae bacterium]